MITGSHMRLLEEELEGLRDRISAGRASADGVRVLQRLAARMLADGRGGEFEPALVQIRDLLEAVSRNMASQARLRRIAEDRSPP